MATYTVRDKKGTYYTVGFIAEKDEKGEWKWEKLTLKKPGLLKGIKFGSCHPWHLHGTKAYEIYVENLTKATVDTGVYAWEIHPERYRYDYYHITNSATIAKKSGFDELIGHALLSSCSKPEWISEGNFSREEMAEIIRDHITTVMRKGSKLGFTEWVVVSEPYLPPYRVEDPLYKAFGNYDYIDYGFQIARETDPNARLIYNDTDNHSPDGLTTNLTMKTIARLKSKNLVDAVGLQLHLGDWVRLPTTPHDINAIKQTIQRYKAMGVDVVITEFDVNLTGVRGSRSERLRLQAKIYREIVRVALETGVKDIIFWGIIDSESWIEFANNQLDGDPTLFYEDLQPKPAYYAILAVLVGNE